MKDIKEMNMAEVVEDLKQYDPKLEEHLKKLLDVARNKPKSFCTILAMLKFY